MNKKNYSSSVFTSLDHKLMKLEHIKHDENLLTGKNCFTRKKRKLSFIEDMKILMSVGSSSMKKELFRYFNYDINTVSLPGFIKSRAKIKDEAFKELMKMMNKAYPCNKTYKGYRLLAVDGSELPVSTDINDTDTHCNDSSKDGHDSLHINALYDILNHRYLDNIVQPIKKKHETNAMITMARRYEGGKAIFIADRFYGSFNCVENIRHTNHKFLIRIKD
ncbi:MAG: transposase, partial [Erysipelotrichaceae bacterium]|nr:transposase [Erysipelotrichaceae bacterium]